MTLHRATFLALALLVLVTNDHAAAQQAAVSPERIRAALARYRDEPSIDVVVRAAMSAPPLDPERARDAAERARLAGLLPRTRAELRRGQGLDLSALQSNTGERSVWSSDDSLSIAGSVTFELGRLIFAREEAGLLRERRALEERRLALVTQVIHVYFERRRLQVERDLAGTTELVNELRIAEAEALLDVFTSGAFSRMLHRSIERDGAVPGSESPRLDE